MSQTVTNYSRFADTEGVFVPTEITIGYDVPWRQVQALLLLAAARTPGVRREPAPFVRQAALEDAYVRYTLLFCLERPAQRTARRWRPCTRTSSTRSTSTACRSPRPTTKRIPATPKIVPEDQWFAAPAAPTTPAAAPAAASQLRT